MLILSTIYLLFFLVYELNIYSVNINDIFAILIGTLSLSVYLLKDKPFNNIHTLSFLNKDLKYIVISGLSIIFIHFLFSSDNLFNSSIRAFRIVYFFVSLFSSIYIMNYSLVFIDKKDNNLPKLIEIIIYTTFIILFISVINSLFGNCKIQYGGSFCLLNQKSYSANGYIALSFFYINIILRNLIYDFNIKLSNLNFTNFFNIFNLIGSSLILINSGSRGAITVLILTLVTLYFKKLKNLIKLKITWGGLIILSSILLIFYSKILFNFNLRALTFIVDPSLSSQRFFLPIFAKDSLIFGIGNFNLLSPFSSTNFDGTLRLFTISYGLVGLVFFTYLIYFFTKKILFLKEKLIIIKNPKSIRILYATFIYTLTFSFANENIIINGNSIIFIYSFVMPLIMLNYFSNSIFIKLSKENNTNNI